MPTFIAAFHSRPRHALVIFLCSPLELLLHKLVQTALRLQLLELLQHQELSFVAYSDKVIALKESIEQTSKQRFILSFI